jgi:tripartite-type tricarboxylate transporter receptor subunit TctC
MGVTIRATVRLLAAALALFAAGAEAQSPAAKPIRFVVPFGPGGGIDVLARSLSQKMSERGRLAMVDNRPGASGIVGVELVMRAPADGFTLLVADSGHFAINPNIHPKLPYDPLRDFAPVVEAASTHLFLTVGAAFSGGSVGEFVAMSKSLPDALLFGSSGNGSPHHLAMEMLRVTSGAKLVHVPYKGVAQAVPALLAGDVVAIFAGASSTLAHVKAGRLRMLAVVSERRAGFLPNIPTVAESGYPECVVGNTIGILAPKATPAEMVRELNAAVTQVLILPEMTSRLAELGLDIAAGTPEQFGLSIQRQLEQYAKLVKMSGAKVD